jgi:hypothetical protein
MKRVERETQIKRIRWAMDNFEENSNQAHDERLRLSRHDNSKLEERATKFREFLEGNS